MRRSLFTFIVLATLIICSETELNATHIVGGDLTYRCLGDNKFEISLTVRRDCLNGSPGAQFDDPASLGIYDGSGSLRTELASSGVLRMTFRPDDTLNEVISNNCGLIGGNICVHTTTYRDTITLPYRNDGYILAYQRCCRNYTISNIIDPLTVGSTFTIRIFAEAIKACNSSPVLNQWPPIYVCGNSPLHFNLTATDADGDSLVYELCNPLTGADQANPKPNIPSAPVYDPVIFKSPYSLNDMIGGSPALTIGRFNGQMIGFVQANITQYLIAYCVKEYRKGVLFSELQREFQINVRTCVSNAIALFDYELKECENPTKIQLYNKSLSPNSTLRSIHWIFDIGGKISTSNDQNPEITVSDSGSIKIKLIAESREGCTDTIEKLINYQNIKPTLVSDTVKICKGDSVSLIASFVKGLQYEWFPSLGLDCSNCPNPKASPEKDRWYYILTKSNQCQNTDSIFVKVNPCVQDTCAINILEKCLTGGTVEITIVDAFGNNIVPATRDHELFWNIKSSPSQNSYSIRNKNPVILKKGTEFSITSKIYSWDTGLPKTIEYADICERRIQYKAQTNCTGPCEEIEFILSSCLDTYDEDNNLNYPAALCESICKNECKFIVALFEKNGQLINPSEYSIKWSTGSSGAYVELMIPYYNTLTVEVRKGDCIWYGRYIRSCPNKPGSNTDINDLKLNNTSSISSLSSSNLKFEESFVNSENKLTDDNFIIYPIPASDLIKFIYTGNNKLSNVNIEIYNISGILIAEIRELPLKTEVIQINQMNTGLYHIVVKYKDRIFSKRILILN